METTVAMRSTSWLRAIAHGVITVAAGAFIGAEVMAQCSTPWVPPAATVALNGNIYALTAWDRDGLGPQPAVLVVGGEFTMAGATPCNRVAIHDPATGTWSALGSGVTATPGWLTRVFALHARPDGTLVVGGRFDTAGGVSASSVATWNGSNWSALGAGVSGEVRALTTLPSGQLMVAGQLVQPTTNSAGVARWDGNFWYIVPWSPTDVRALTNLPNGDVVAGGFFQFAGAGQALNVARWPSTSFSPSWYPMSSGLSTGGWPGVEALVTLPNGDVIAGGTSMVARWNGSSWSQIAAGTDGTVRSLAVMPNGDVVAAGTFSTVGGVAANNIARWNGSTWSALGSGTGGSGGGAVYALTQVGNGDLMVGGAFSVAGGGAADRVARVSTTCPAAAIAQGSGCSGGGGPNVLHATTLPWIGSSYRSVVTGLPGWAIAVDVIGFGTAQTSLAALHPAGGAQCSLLVTPDLLALSVPTVGQAVNATAIPNSLALVGSTFFEQVVSVEINLSGVIIALTSSQRLQLTIGSI
jgi:hypothetical protein